MFATRRVGALALAAIIGLTACGSDDKAAPIAMPDVTGSQLDTALSNIEKAGIEDEVDIDGGGTFGVVDKSNWTVCVQSPAAGKAVDSAPRLTVDRSCGEEDSAEEPTPTSEPTPETAAPESTVPAVEPTLTTDSNADLAALLRGTDTCAATIRPEYCSRTVVGACGRGLASAWARPSLV